MTGFQSVKNTAVASDSFFPSLDSIPLPILEIWGKAV